MYKIINETDVLTNDGEAGYRIWTVQGPTTYPEFRVFIRDLASGWQMRSQQAYKAKMAAQLHSQLVEIATAHLAWKEAGL